MVVLIRVIFVIVALFLAFNIYRRIRSGEKLSVGDLIQALAVVVSAYIATIPNIVVQSLPSQQVAPTQTVAMSTSTSEIAITPTATTLVESASVPTNTPTMDAPSTTTQRIVFKDDFQDSDATSVNWSSLGGTWLVENGVLTCTANGKYLAKITMPEDFTFQLDIMGTNVIDKIIVFRAIDDSTHYGIDFRTAPYNDIVLVKSLPGNVGQIIQTVPFENYNNTWYTVKVDVENNHIKVFVNDQPTIDFIDGSSPITNGTVGVGAMLQPGFSVVYYDNFVISHH